MIFNVNGGGGGVDIRDTTATASTVLDGNVFYLSDGTRATGNISTVAGLGHPMEYVDSFPGGFAGSLTNNLGGSSRYISLPSGYYSVTKYIQVPRDLVFNDIQKAISSSMYSELASGILGVGAYGFAGYTMAAYFPHSLTLSNVLTIESNAFFCNAMLNRLELPNYSGGFKSSVFYSCYNLQELICPNASGSVAWNAFFSCSNLMSFAMKHCSYVAESAFYSCASLSYVSLPGCSSIGNYAFNRCASLTSIYIPDVLTISLAAFTYCTKLTNINLPSCSTVGSSAFRNCSLLTSISMPLLESLGNEAFAECWALSSVNMPVLTVVGSSVFSNCSALTAVNLPSASKVGSFAFYGCSTLPSISLSVCDTVGSAAFQNCSNLESVTLSKYISVINNGVFSGDTNLKTVNKGVVCLDDASSNINYINANTFAGCGLLSFAVTGTALRILSSAFTRCYSLSLFSLYVSSENGYAASINGSAFAYCSNLMSVYLLGGYVSSVATAAFVGTPISASVGGVYGSVYVPASYYSSYIKQTGWSLAMKSRIVSMTSVEEQARINELVSLFNSWGT